jgi:hypothetical protein
MSENSQSVEDSKYLDFDHMTFLERTFLDLMDFKPREAQAYAIELLTMARDQHRDIREALRISASHLLAGTILPKGDGAWLQIQEIYAGYLNHFAKIRFGGYLTSGFDGSGPVRASIYNRFTLVKNVLGCQEKIISLMDQIIPEELRMNPPSDLPAYDELGLPGANEEKEDRWMEKPSHNE